MASGDAGRLHQVMAAMARPVRLTRGKALDDAWQVEEGLMTQEEERALWAAYQAAAAQVSVNFNAFWSYHCLCLV
jgi:glycyl-tRNA synthetase